MVGSIRCSYLLATLMPSFASLDDYAHVKHIFALIHNEHAKHCVKLLHFRKYVCMCVCARKSPAWYYWTPSSGYVPDDFLDCQIIRLHVQTKSTEQCEQKQRDVFNWSSVRSLSF